MTQPRFPLKMSDGSEVRSLEELREHADFGAITARFDDGALRRWLRVWGFIEEAEKVEELDSAAEGFHKALYDALGIPWTEEADAQLMAYVEAEIERESVPARTSMDDAMCDEVARLLNYQNDECEFVETDDYIFLNSEPSDKDGKWIIISKLEGKNINPMPLEVSWGRSTNSIADLIIETLKPILIDGIRGPWDNQLRLKRSKMRAYRNQVLWADRKSISVVDLETCKVKEIVTWSECTCNGFVTDAVNDRIAYTIDFGENEESLWLCDLKDGTRVQITANGEPIKASKAILTENALFFVCEESEMMLDDGEDPVGCICRYDLDTGKSRVLANLKIGDFGLRHIGFGNNRLYICGTGDGDYYYCDISADVPTNTIRFKRFSEDLGAADYLESGEGFLRAGIFSFQDGFVFLGGSKEKMYLCFLDFVTGEKRFFPLADTKEKVSRFKRNGGTWFRLGNWLYYSIKADSETDAPRERWKISLETGEQVKLPCGD